MLDFLPNNLKKGLKYVNLKFIYEIRMRADRPITVNFQGKFTYLGEYGITQCKEKALVCTYSDIADCVYSAGKYSVYSVEEQIRKGFITTENGVRIGLAGEFVFEKGQPLSLKNFSSLCIRIPHEVIGCGEEIFRCCMSDRVRSVLVMSPPGLGKTTILRDLGRILSEQTKLNILICDERGEISVGKSGDTCDVIMFSDKETAFEMGIRVMRPDIIITDEISERDCAVLERATNAGIAVLASAHFSDKRYVSHAFKRVFERFILLDTQQIGKIMEMYDRDGVEC